jgi:hypothetical protein
MEKLKVNRFISISLLILFLGLEVFLVINKTFGEYSLYIVAYSQGIIFLFDLAVRKVEWFKPYFTSDYNFFAAKTRYRQELDFSKKILFEKLIEVLQASKFKLVTSDESKGYIFAISPISLFSWGENIYIDLNEADGKTTMDFCSACLFQISSYGKNKRNYQKFLDEFEKSLTI